MKRQITVADAIFGGGSLLAFLFSFFDFIGAGSFGVSAWASGGFPLGTIPAILGLLGVIVVVLDLTGAAKLPDQVLTLNWRQIRLTWGITAAVIMICYLIVDKSSASRSSVAGSCSSARSSWPPARSWPCSARAPKWSTWASPADR